MPRVRDTLKKNAERDKDIVSLMGVDEFKREYCKYPNGHGQTYPNAKQGAQLEFQKLTGLSTTFFV